MQDYLNALADLRTSFASAPPPLQRSMYQAPAPKFIQNAPAAASAASGGGTGAAAGTRSLIDYKGLQVTPDEQWVIEHESGGDVNAVNPSSGALGIGQLNPSSGTLQSIAAETGYDPQTRDPQEQLAMFRRYEQDRYGSDAAAKAFWIAHNWY